ncbi:YggS family pyridoxal phosphate-dependent enzyme [Cytobacillus purgationiresistens]|uniref:Pyridoxal phosphate homeostasis protein n=1 Tax=Cytobacillus purgationiresistens TaxID=863449 RepID=A0ABU0AHG8_9BACI|nr:YggS family pyridoxal phosphate-dependent enzyme [Cytobacillus purgationiresistens]MDQ0270319.1 pyridoxal phosphate enzyme (YggS family) [Cytobacillus purgationiresistens]
MRVQENLNMIKANIDSACEKVKRDPKDIRIIAVTKYVSIDRAAEAVEAGILDLGENRDEGLQAKWDVLKDKPTWHFIGTLQTRKVKNIIDKVDCIHSLDRLSLAKEINKRTDKVVDCLVQVNVSGEESKQGIDPNDAIEFINALKPLTNIRVIGLMTMAPFTSDEEILRSSFKRLKGLQEQVQFLRLAHAPCNELSMGMSNDFIIAIEEGATMVRIGTALVGNES